MHEGHRQRLRKRYLNSGLDGFAEHEVLELLLTYVLPRVDTNGMAHQLIDKFGSLEGVFCAQVQELTSIQGIGEKAAIFLRLQGEVARSFSVRRSLQQRERLASPIAAVRFALHLLSHERYECVVAVSLDKNMRLLHSARIASGTLTEVPLYPRLVVESALHHRAHAVLLLHNHPSGDPTPSEGDLKATEAVRLALNAIDIRLFDHLVVGNDMVYSYARGIFIDVDENVYAQLPTTSTPAANETKLAAEPTCYGNTVQSEGSWQCNGFLCAARPKAQQ